MARRPDDSRGSIYIEALIALAILATALIPLIGAFSLAPAARQEALQQVTALNLAREQLEVVHARGPDLSGFGYRETVELDGVVYTVAVTVAPVVEVAEGQDPEQAEPVLYDVTATVTWTGRKGETRQVTLASSAARRP